MYEEENSAYSSAYRQYAQDQILESCELQVERKFFRLEVRENDRGRFLRITEENQGRRNTVIVPDSGFADFARAVNEVLATQVDPR
ncbi:MAG: DNA-binding protein [Chthoniobacterales bacterium]